jgi:hypothetical protein
VSGSGHPETVPHELLQILFRKWLQRAETSIIFDAVSDAIRRKATNFGSGEEGGTAIVRKHFLVEEQSSHNTACIGFGFLG